MEGKEQEGRHWNWEPVMSVPVRSERSPAKERRNRASLCAAQGTSSGVEEQKVDQNKDNN